MYFDENYKILFMMKWLGGGYTIRVCLKVDCRSIIMEFMWKIGSPLRLV